ncbi:MAG TPA: hypothetical protein VF488_12395, partial [Gemmatimonadaceae bacterium]
KEIGVRVSGGAVFADVRLASATGTSGCLINEPCVEHTEHLVIFGAGVDFVHLGHVGLGLRGQLLTDGRDLAPLLGLGLGLQL